MTQFHESSRLSASPDEQVLSKKAHRESFEGIGTVTIRPFQIGEDGTRHYDESVRHNLIVREGRKTLVDLLIGATGKRLKFIRWGSGGAPSFPDGDPLEPYDVEDGDLDVSTIVVDKLLNTAQRVSPTEIRFTETIISDEVDSDINEAALLFEDPANLAKSIFARITFPTNRLTSDQGTGIEIIWSIRFDKVSEESV